jgi:hypothetical protein
MSSIEKRTIKINPELFKVPEKNTSRKRKPASEVKIKVKSSPKPHHNKTLRRSVMNLIRQKQMEEYKKLADDNKEKNASSHSSNDSSEFNKDFNSSLDFFENLVEKQKEETINHNHTFKKYPNPSPQSLIFHPISENINTEFHDVSKEVIPTDESRVHIHRPPLHVPPPPTLLPTMGCLKNGFLPTRRSLLNSTVKNRPQMNVGPSPTPLQMIQTNQSSNSSYAAPKILPLESPRIHQMNNPISEIKKDLSEKRQKFEKGQSLHGGFKNKLKYLKRRKIYKRTYKIGRSQFAPTVSVLVSNKTIRNRISTEAQLLKQTPIQDVKKYLIKKGFIKVGTIAPNDVLRKMYETVHLICGEVDNHNPENLLFNFIHGADK